jgi:mono/diheme cytochrome c family protein
VNKRLLTVGGLAAISMVLVSGRPSQTVAQPRQQTPASNAAAPRAVVDQYCVGCHNADDRIANLALDELDFTKLGEDAEIAETVVRKLRAGLMPPTGSARPDAATREALITWMENELDRSAVVHLPAPGLHRMNRTEYTNAIRDVLGLEVDATKFLPPDDSTSGFDNIAGALTMSPALMQGYLAAAGKISRLAMNNVSGSSQAVYDVAPDTQQNRHIEGLPFGTRGGMLIRHEFPADGEYVFEVRGMAAYSGGLLGGVTGEKLEILIDGELVRVLDWDSQVTRRNVGGETARIPIKAGLSHGRCDVSRNHPHAGQRHQQSLRANHELAGQDLRIPVLSACRPGPDRRSLQCRRHNRQPQPPQDSCVPAKLCG